MECLGASKTMGLRPAVRSIYLLVIGLLCFAALDAGLRLYMREPVLAWRDWRGPRDELLRTSGALYDPGLGWTQRPDFESGGFDTLEYGIRKNSTEDEELTPGAVLAVGDSFTAGSEVVNEDTWPAQLERKLSVRVINAGVGGYGVDQSVLNAERLLAAVKPRAVIVGIYEEDIQRVAYRNYNAPKPYFTREGSSWVLKNHPVPKHTESTEEPLYKRALAHSLVAHVVLSRFRDYWYAGGGPGYERATGIPAPETTTCYVLERLRRQLSEQNISAVVVMQYGGWIHYRDRQRPAYAQAVLRCAAELRYAIVDEFDTLRAVAKKSLSELQQNYVMAGANTYGHMSAQGNALVASLIAEKMRASLDLQSLAPWQDAGKGTLNKIISAKPRRLIRANVDIQPQEETAAPIVSEPVYLVSATRTDAETYLVTRWSGEQPGIYTFSAFVQPRDGNDTIVQIHDDQGSSAVARYSMSSGQFTITPVGKVESVAPKAEKVADGWLRLSVSARLRGHKGTAVLQLAPGRPSPSAPVQMMVQGLMVEHGPAATVYCRPRSRCPAQASAQLPFADADDAAIDGTRHYPIQVGPSPKTGGSSP